MIYLDNNATTKPDDRVVEAMNRVQVEAWGNPSSVHRFGQQARSRLELARESLAALIGAKPRMLTLTGSGTEAIDLAIRGSLVAQGLVGRAAERLKSPTATIVTTRAEHSAVRELAVDLERREGVCVLWAKMREDSSGVIDVPALEELLDQNAPISIVSIQWANNETGAIQPVEAISKICRSRGVVYHCDATQWVGKMPVADLSLFDMLTFSPHKFHGPKGVGVLYCRPGTRVAPIIMGEQELGRRGGTQNVAGIVGAGIAAELAAKWLADETNIRRGGQLRDRFERAILDAVPETSVNGPGGSSAQDRLWNTSNIAFERLEAEALLLLLSEYSPSVCCSAGAACSSGSLEPSSVLLATGIAPKKAHGSLRFSLSRYSTEVEIDAAARIVSECAQRLRRSISEL